MSYRIRDIDLPNLRLRIQNHYFLRIEVEQNEIELVATICRWAASATSTSTPAGGKSKAAVNGTSKSRRGGGHEAGESGPLLPVGNLVSDTFQRTVNTHDVQGNYWQTNLDTHLYQKLF